MAQERSNTPEKQLLRLIEEPQGQNSNPKDIQYRGPRALSVDALKGRFSFFKERLDFKLFFKSAFLDIKKINRLLAFCVLVLVLYSGISLTISIMNINKIPDLASDVSAKMANEASQEVSLLKKSSFYLDKPRARDIFKFGTVISKIKDETLPPAPAEIVPEKTKLEQAMEHLSLVGISWSDEPDAMIEDTSSKKIHFIKRGDVIDGSIKIETILKDRVILSCDGKEAELR